MFERVKILEMKIKHVSRGFKGQKKATNFEPEDLNESKDEIQEAVTSQLKTHFEEALTSALIKLESYGNLINVINHP